MTKEEIGERLNSTYSEFSEYITSLSPDDFLFSPAPGKWSSGQQAVHIWKSVRILNLALTLPDWFLKIYVGKANRPSRTYDEVVVKYKQKLSLANIRRNPFAPKEVDATMQNKIVRKINRSVSILCNKLSTYSEERLDKLILPHPLLGKLTLREMMYFTIYHGSHHMDSIRINLEFATSE